MNLIRLDMSNTKFSFETNIFYILLENGIFLYLIGTYIFVA